MNFCRRLFYIRKLASCSIVLLVASCFSWPHLANAQNQNITVEIAPNQSVTVSPSDSFFDGAFNTGVMLSTTPWTGSPVADDSSIDSGFQTFQSYSNYDFERSVPSLYGVTASQQVSMFRPTRYLKVGMTNFNTTAQHPKAPTDNYGTQYQMDFINYLYYPSVTFNYPLFAFELTTAVFGADDLKWFVDFLRLLANLPTGSDFTYTVPSLFGFDTGFTFTVPLSSLLAGAGQWSNFSMIFDLIRAIFGFCYYTAVFVFMLHSIVYRQ